MKRSIGIFLCAIAPLVIMGVLTTYVVAQNPSRDFARETKDMATRIASMQERVGLIVQDIARRPDAGEVHYRRMSALNDAVVDLSEQLNDAFIATQKLIENDVFHDDTALNRDVVGARQQLDHMAKDLENMLQYVEHMSYQLGRAPSI